MSRTSGGSDPDRQQGAAWHIDSSKGPRAACSPPGAAADVGDSRPSPGCPLAGPGSRASCQFPAPDRVLPSSGLRTEYSEDLSRATCITIRTCSGWTQSLSTAVARSTPAHSVNRRTGDPAQAQRVSDVYSGKFALDFAYEEWATPIRDSMHARYLEIVERAVTQDADCGQMDRAIRLAQRALEIDPELDEVEGRSYKLYTVAGAHAAAAEQYGHYSLGQRDLGLDPPRLRTWWGDREGSVLTVIRTAA